MDLREPLLGPGNSISTPLVIRKKSDYPILTLIGPKPRPASPREDQFLHTFEQVGRGDSGAEFQVGSAPTRRIYANDFLSSTPCASSLLARSSFLTPDLSGVGPLHRIPEEPHHLSDLASCSSNASSEQERQEQDDEEPDLEAPVENSGNDGNEESIGVFGEPLTDDAQEETEAPKEQEKEGYSWASGLAGLLLSVPLLPSLPDVLNPFRSSPEFDDDEFMQCARFDGSGHRHRLHEEDERPAAEEQTVEPATPRRLKDLFYSSLPNLALPDLLNLNSYSEDNAGHSDHTTPAVSPKGPARVFPIEEDEESPYVPVADGYDHIHHYVRKTGKKNLRRCRTAPMLTGVNKFSTKKLGANVQKAGRKHKISASSVVWQASMGLIMYLCIGVIIYIWKREEFSGIETVGVIDALYFCIVTMCTIGYGDITPITPSAKILAVALVFVGFGFVDALMSGMVTFVLDRQEHLLLTAMEDGHHEKAKSLVMDTKKGRMRIRMKVALAVGTVLSAITVGVLVLHHMEELNWIDALYATCISITTVGYGDVSFQTMWGRLFAAVWLLFSTLGVARAFLFLAEARVHSRHRILAKKVLQRKMTTNDLMAMDLDNDGHISKSEFVVFKLKEMGKIDELDIVEICKQFDYIDSMNAGKITLGQLLGEE